MSKYVRRRRFLRHLRRVRITADELARRLKAGDNLVIVDFRTALDVETTPYRIPGARWITPEALDDPHPIIPKDSEVVLYCAEPREATSARMALLLDAHGYKNVTRLAAGWKAGARPALLLNPCVSLRRAKELDEPVPQSTWGALAVAGNTFLGNSSVTLRFVADRRRPLLSRPPTWATETNWTRTVGRKPLPPTAGRPDER